MLVKSKIDYLDFAWNFYPGCNHWKTVVCPLPNCWAHSLATRFHRDFTPHLIPERLLDPLQGKQGGRNRGQHTSLHQSHAAPRSKTPFSQRTRQAHLGYVLRLYANKHEGHSQKICI